MGPEFCDAALEKMFDLAAGCGPGPNGRDRMGLANVFARLREIGIGTATAV